MGFLLLSNSIKTIVFGCLPGAVNRRSEAAPSERQWVECTLMPTGSLGHVRGLNRWCQHILCLRGTELRTTYTSIYTQITHVHLDCAWLLISDYKAPGRNVVSVYAKVHVWVHFRGFIRTFIPIQQIRCNIYCMGSCNTTTLLTSMTSMPAIPNNESIYISDSKKPWLFAFILKHKMRINVSCTTKWIKNTQKFHKSGSYDFSSHTIALRNQNWSQKSQMSCLCSIKRGLQTHYDITDSRMSHDWSRNDKNATANESRSWGEHYQ